MTTRDRPTAIRAVSAAAMAVIMATHATGQTVRPTDQVTYVMATRTVAYERADLASPVVNTFQPLAVVVVKGAAGGWMYVEPGTVRDAETEAPGWIRADPKDIVPASLLAVGGIRRGDVDDKSWPLQTKVDVLRGRVRIGHTLDQLRIAHRTTIGREGVVRQASEETAAGVVETWVCPDAVYTVAAGKVTKIARIE